MTAGIQANPVPIDVLIMTQGNYSLFESLNGTSGSVPVVFSKLNVTSYTASFTATASGLYYLVLITPRTNTYTDVVVQLAITRFIITDAQNDLPYVIVVFGVILLALGVLSRPSKPAAPSAPQKKQGQTTKAITPAVAQATVSQAQGSTTKSVAPTVAKSPFPQVAKPSKCRYCGAAMTSKQVFCPKCSRSQE